MDFTSVILDQRQKLNSWDYVNSLWCEIEESEDVEANPNAISDFNNHLPVLLEQFWETALEKCNEKEFVTKAIDEDLKKYLLVLIYQCITQSQDTVSLKCTMNACEVYLCLLITKEDNDYFRSKLYRGILSTLQTSLDNNSAANISLIRRLRKFLCKTKLKSADLEITLATLLQVIFTKSRKVFDSFDTDIDDGPASLQSLLCLKILLKNELLMTRRFLITTYLFNGLRKYNSVHLTPQAFSIIQLNFRRLLKDKTLHQKFKDDDYQTFLNAFVHVWEHPDFIFFNEAVLIMNDLKEKHYKILIETLNKILMSKSPCKNLFKFALAVICNASKHSDLNKIKVTNEILLKSIIINFISPKTDVSNAAIDAFAEILLSPDLEKEHVREPIKTIFNSLPGGNVLDVPTVLKGLKSLVNKKWRNKSRNKHLFVISVSIILYCEKDYPMLYQEILESLTEEASPFDLKPFLHLISETYLKTCTNHFANTSFQLLKIIFKMAIHPMASSTEFAKYLYMAMIFPSICKGVPIKNEYFIDPILSSDFNYEEFFQKCHTLGLIKKEHIVKLIGNLYTFDESRMRVACAIVHLTDYKNLSFIADHINDNFLTICNNRNLTYLLYIYIKILKNNLTSRASDTLRCNEIMVCFLKQHLTNQNLRWNSVTNAFALLKSLENFTDLSEDFRRMKEEYDVKLSQGLASGGSIMPVLCFSQLVIFSKYTPSDENMRSVTNFLLLCADERHQRSPEFNPKLWIASLLLYTNFCVVKTNFVENGMNFIQSGLKAPVIAVKLASLNMKFDLCNMVTHNFEDLIKYMFKQLVYGDSVFKKTCLLKIDKLIRDDYLKLELEQFLIFVSNLADKNYGLGQYSQQLFSEHFFISNTTLIAKYFVALIVHINGYKTHPLYNLSNKDYKLLEIIRRNNLDRRKMYTLLLTSLPIKARFNIVYAVSVTLLNQMMKGKIKFEDGFWKMIKDSIFTYKLLCSNANDEDSSENYYKKVSQKIQKYLLGHAEYPEKRLYSEHAKEILQGTETLLKLLFFNDNENIQKHIRISVFDALMHWTDFLMAEIVHIVHVDRVKEVQSSYTKVDSFFKKHLQMLRYDEETFESESSISNFSISSTSSIFNAGQQFIPDFDM